ncbi:MAG TPA: hypothetical protein VMW38_20675, partial [Terriglobia bacterium]|nr:hypothetical protein [Terriglobia bacterium]
LAPCRQVRQLAANKLEALDARIRELQHLQRVLSHTITGWDQQLARTPSGTRAGLLEMLAASDARAATELSPLLAPALRRTLGERQKK